MDRSPEHTRWRGLFRPCVTATIWVARKFGFCAVLPGEATLNGWLDAETAAGIDQIAGIKQQGVRAGNWLIKAQAEVHINCPDPSTWKGKRDRAVLALLVGCGLRCGEAVNLTMDHIQNRDGRWVIIDLRGKHGRVRTIPMPGWVKLAVEFLVGGRRDHRRTPAALS